MAADVVKPTLKVMHRREMKPLEKARAHLNAEFHGKTGEGVTPSGLQQGPANIME